MKMKFLLATLVGTTFFTNAVWAQTVTSTENNVTCTAGKQCVKDGKKCDNKGKCDKRCHRGVKALNCRQGENMKRDMFAGINLTDTQKTQLEALKQRRQQQRDEIRANRPAKDSTLTREQRRALRVQREAKNREGRLEYLREVKEIIGPDNYVIFLENMIVDRPNVGKKMARTGKNMKNKYGKRGHDRRGKVSPVKDQAMK
ncbi:MAG: hypothetical protein J6C44_06690 [Muribaculaceae bacterium]|nr:hypothetical protein [Muribaculaceae bacterium]